jgi:hypothetical protein
MRLALCAFVLTAPALWAGVSCNQGAGTLPCPAHPAVYTVTGTAGVGAHADGQAAIDDAHVGDTIKFEAGTRWTTSDAAFFTLDHPPTGCVAGGAQVTITTTEDAKLPPEGARITPAYAPLLPRFTIGSGNGPVFLAFNGTETSLTSNLIRSSFRSAGTPTGCWKFRGLLFEQLNTDPNATQAISRGFIQLGGAMGFAFSRAGVNLAQANYTFASITVASGVATVSTGSAVHGLVAGDRVRMDGFTAAPATSMNGQVYAVTGAPTTTTFTFAVAIADGTYTEDTMEFRFPAERAQLAHNVTIDQIVTRNNGLSRVTRDVYVNARDTRITNSWLSAARDSGTDSQIVAYGGSAGSDFVVENNYMGALASENFFTGGVAQIVKPAPNNFRVRYNFMHHPEWEGRQRTWPLLKSDNPPLVFRGRPVLPTRITTVNQDSASGTNVLYVANTAWAVVGETIHIGRGTERYESKRIGSIQAGVSLTFNNTDNSPQNLTYTHTSADADPVATNYYFIAMTSGQQGTTEPVWCNTAGCEVSESGVANPVTWRRWSSAGVCSWCIKNNFELKGGKDVYVRYNVFDTMWPDGQNAGINIKGTCESDLPTYHNLGPATKSGTLSLASGGTAATWVSGDQFGTVFQTPSVHSLTINVGANTVTASSSAGVNVNYRYGFIGTDVPGGAAAGTLYYVRQISGSTFKLSTSASDAGIITLTTTGTAPKGFSPDYHGSVYLIDGVYYEAQPETIRNLSLTLKTAVPGAPKTTAYRTGADPRTRLISCMGTENLYFEHNWLRSMPQVVNLTAGGVNVSLEMVRNMVFRHNLSTDNDPLKWSNSTGGIYSGQSRALFGAPFGVQTIVENNTFISQNIAFSIFADSSVFYHATYGSRAATDMVIRNNIFAGATTGAHYQNHTGLLYGCPGATCPLSQWDRNVYAGANLSTFTSPGAKTSLCGSSTATGSCSAPDYFRVFSDFAKANYLVPPGSDFRRAGTDGADYGADLTQVPAITGLSVAATDRLVRFQFSVSQPLAHLAYSVEVSTAPDFGAFTGTAYAGEQSAPGTYVRRDLDSHDLHVAGNTGYPARPATQREIVVGQDVPLAADTLYYYRLSGTDTRVGTFRTLPALSGTTSVSVSQAGAASMTWGYAYSRSTDTISDAPGGGSGSCAAGVCTASGITRGRLIYYRIGSGPVRSYLVP